MINKNEHTEKVPDNCPHCGRELSPWEKVLLSVDRALMCKNCWYRIILGIKIDKSKSETQNDNDETKNNQ